MRHGFIFSLDAFVAFTLVMVTVGMLIFIIGTPKPFYPSLGQAHMLAHDTLQVLATSSDMNSTAPGYKTYLQQIFSGSSSAKQVMYKVAGGNATYPGTIPNGFGYKLEKYDFQEGGWSGVPLYDAGADCSFSSALPASDRCGKSFTKLQATAITFASIYTDPPQAGQSPYCYLSCFGYPRPAGTTCDAVPCNVSKWNFWPGNSSIQLVRLAVYT